jgi:Tfp pilus assembly protein PilX
MGQQVVIETVYRVSAMGFGANRSTTANLQSTFRRQ